MSKKYWFIRKSYGWGWRPASWQGWVVLGLYFGSLATLFLKIDSDSHSVSDTLINFFLPLVCITTILFVVTWLKGEVPPKWQWGRISNNERKGD